MNITTNDTSRNNTNTTSGAADNTVESPAGSGRGAGRKTAGLLGMLAVAGPVLARLPLDELPPIAAVRVDRVSVREWGRDGLVALQLDADIVGRGTVAHVVRAIDAVAAWARALPNGVLVTDLDYRGTPSGQISARAVLDGVAVEVWDAVSLGPELGQTVMEAIGEHDPHRGVVGDVEAGGRALLRWADQHRPTAPTTPPVTGGGEHGAVSS